MTLQSDREVAKFDRYAQEYQQAHAASVRASGEAPEFFAQHKLACLRRLGLSSAYRVLDYGCGTGSLTRVLAGEQLQVEGYDPSASSLEVARKVAPAARFHEQLDSIEEAAFDVVVLAGVLHHIPPAQRLEALRVASTKLRPGSGLLCVFEHNPYNPLTVRAVQQCPFDDDAVLLPPREVRKRLAEVGLVRVRQEYVLFFPRSLSALRPLEPWLSRVPLGAQTLTWAVRG